LPLLYYWRGDNYRRDLDFGAGYHLNQSNPLMHAIERGDSLWAFTRRPDGCYVLAAELVVAGKTLNPAGYRYGRYRVWGDLTRSRYFQVQDQPDLTVLVRSLSVRAGGQVLGRAFQGKAAVRRMTSEDHRILEAYARWLPIEPRARLLPEERLEALLVSGDPESVQSLLAEEPSGLAAARREYLIKRAATRRRLLTADLRDLYRGSCQLCRWAPRSLYETELCEGHHVRWLSRGGDDELSNMVLLCPNHHRAVHACDAPFDWASMGFAFPNGTERVVLLEHPLAA
jgi:hypothetical protein